MVKIKQLEQIFQFVQIFITWNRNLREAAFVGAWGLIAVATANWDGNKSIAYTAIAVVVVIFISSAAHGFVNRGQHFLEETQRS